MFRTIKICLSMAGVLSALACSVLLDADRPQCENTSDCVSRGSAFSNTQCILGICEEEKEGSGPIVNCDDVKDCESGQLCIEDVCENAFQCAESGPEPSTEAISVTVPVQSVLNGDRMPGVATRLCRTLDPACDLPVMNLVSNSEGMLEFDLPPGFSGYLEFDVESFFPTLYFIPPNPSSGEELTVASMSPVSVIQGLGAAVGAPPDPDRGHLILAISNCFGPAEGVSISSPHEDKESLAFYVLDSIPTAQITETTVSGSSGFLNFPPGNTAVTMTLAETGEEVGKVSLIMRAGYISSIGFLPEGAL